MTTRRRDTDLPRGTPLRLTARAAAAVGCLALAALAAGPARAAVVVGTFDPAFGAGIANLGYRGTVTIDVPSACFLLAPGLVSNANACSLGSMVVLSSTVEFYNLVEPGTPTFASQSFSFSPLAVTSVVTGTGPSLLGVNAGSSLSQSLSLSDDGPDNIAGTTDDVLYDGDFTLDFLAIDPAQQAGPGPFYTAGMTTQCRPSAVAPVCMEPRPLFSNRALTEFGAPRFSVPEPGGLALAMSALAAALVARRRRAG